MQFGSDGVLYFEIRIHKKELINALTEALHSEIYHFQVEMITTGVNLDIGIRDTLVTLSSEGYATRTEALEAAEQFISDYKEKLKQKHRDR